MDLPIRGLCDGCNQVLSAMAREHGKKPQEFFGELLKAGGTQALRILDCTIPEAVTVKEPSRKPKARRDEHPDLTNAREKARETLRCAYVELYGHHYTFEPVLVGLDVQVREHKTPTGSGRGAA